jgi:hypothetical protein
MTKKALKAEGEPSDENIQIVGFDRLRHCRCGGGYIYDIMGV